MKLLISDMQYPYHDAKAVRNLVDFARYAKPDLVCVGDELDCPQPARWSKGFAEEYAGTLDQHRKGLQDILTQFRQAVGPKREFIISRSNHVDRLETYITKYAPAFAGLPELAIEKFLGYDELGIDYRREISEIAPGWLLAHGDEGSLSRIAGNTALNLAKRLGKSVVCGHTHRAGTGSHTTGYAGKITQKVTGLEVGNLMDMRQAHYLRMGAADWQQAFGVLHVDGNRVSPQLVSILPGGRFTVDGKRWFE